jgi:phosphate transport system substrate-binding protein
MVMPLLALTPPGINAMEPAGAQPPPYMRVKNVEGRFTIAGSNTMFPLMTRLAADFKRYYPDVAIGVEGQGSKSVSADEAPASNPFWEMVQNKSVYRRGDGSDFGHHVSMQVHVLASSRKLSEADLQTFRSRYGYSPIEIPIALEAVAVYVHRDNPIQGLTLKQVDAIFSADHLRGLNEDLATWGQVGLKETWQHAPIHTYGRDSRSGTREFFKEQVLLKGGFRQTLREVPGSASLIVAIEKDLEGIGYSGIGYQSSSVRIVPLASKDGGSYVLPTEETTTDGTYPLTRELYLYVNQKPGETMNPALFEFLKYVNSREGQDTVVRAGVYRLPINEMEKNRSRLMDETLTAYKR